MNFRLSASRLRVLQQVKKSLAFERQFRGFCGSPAKKSNRCGNKPDFLSQKTNSKGEDFFSPVGIGIAATAASAITEEKEEPEEEEEDEEDDEEEDEEDEEDEEEEEEDEDEDEESSVRKRLNDISKEGKDERNEV